MSRHPARNTLTRSFTPRAVKTVAMPVDALAAPDSNSLISAGLSFWPPGAAFGSPDGQAVSLSSVLARFTRVLLSPFEWLYARAFRLALESSAQTVSELLPDWEKDHGLPEACFGGNQTTTQRLTALRRKVEAEPVSHPEDFIRMAAEFGYTIEIEEPAMFRCGFSMCGGKHKVGSWVQETYVIVRIKGASTRFFHVGASRVGRDALFSNAEAAAILCMLRKTLPAWVTPISKPWITLKPLTVGNAPLLDRFGNPLLVRV